MRNIIVTTLIIFSLCSSCNFQGWYFEKNFYEKVSHINFPKDYEVIATADNGEFITITILDFNQTDCQKFYRNNSFEPITDKFGPQLIGLNYLDSIYRQIPDKSKLVRNSGTRGKNDWTYLLDTTTCRLYCEICYPDWSGD